MDREIVSVAYRYLLEQEIDGSDIENLIDSLEDEEFPIREALGEREMNAAIREGVLRFDVTTDHQLMWFGECLRTLSVYLSEYIIGLEVAEGRNAAGFRIEVEIRKYAGCRGDLIAVPLLHTVDFKSGDIAPGLEDVSYLKTHWKELPRWAQDAYRIKFPELRLL
jgi:hypothetical protein